jgi:hypothetical protein
VASTFPYRAIESKQADSKKKNQDKNLHFMDVQRLIGDIFGDSNRWGVMKQLIASPCIIENNIFPFTKDTTCSGCGSGKTDPSALEQNISETSDNQIHQTTASVETDNQIHETNASVETGHLEEQVSKRSVTIRVSQRNRKVEEIPGNSILEQSVSVATGHVEQLRKRSH